MGVLFHLLAFSIKILWVLNVAPSQLFLNIWGYIRAFELVCEKLDVNPTTGVLFSFIATKPANGSWMNLNKCQARDLFTPSQININIRKIGLYRWGSRRFSWDVGYRRHSLFPVVLDRGHSGSYRLRLGIPDFRGEKDCALFPGVRNYGLSGSNQVVARRGRTPFHLYR